MTSDERERLKTLEREVRELRRANELLKSAADRLHRPEQAPLWGRADLPAAADRPVHYDQATRRPASARAVRDAKLKAEIARVHAEHFGVYGAPKVWRQLHREGITVARCTVERLPRDLGLEGVRRGKGRPTPRRMRPPPDPLIW